ncbi:MAG: ArsJ-associated glyceraldehyde-3-phosphate dehydrogenase [Marivibrio sp.]|uniref:ArsJ-associated glyceraldehyde-3-phosphate dehydrogenase n=1 Tax=Marivibrio sp. TaxID=2039719 RepID=UPI0032ECE3B7
MSVRIGINGFGRMGRLSLRALWDRLEAAGAEIATVNEIAGDAETAAHLLAFDSVHGRWRRGVRADGDALIVEERRIAYSAEKTPGAVDWAGLGVDLVLECTGKFKTTEALQPYFDGGVKKLLVACPVKTEPALNLVVGVNDHLYDPDRHHLVTAASCTTNCLAPLVKVVHEGIGVRRGSITTIHDVTNTQVMVDAPKSDLRRARSALNSLIPTTTGSATAIGLIYPELQGRLDGHAVRVPLLNASLTDCAFELERETTAEEVNQLFRDAAAGPLGAVLGVEDRPLVSADYVDDPRSAILDAPSTLVVDGSHLKLYAWYDNEWGYASRMADLALRIAEDV